MGWLTIGLPSVAFLVILVFSWRTKYTETDPSTHTEKVMTVDSSVNIAGLSGLLTALAVLIPLAATWSPWSKISTGIKQYLVTTLCISCLGMLLTIYSIIKLQKVKDFKLEKSWRVVPTAANGTWIALLLLVSGIVLSEATLPQPASPLEVPTQVRFAIAHDLPKLGADRHEIESALGIAVQGDEQGLAYRTTNGVIVFCLDAQGLAEKIVEKREVNSDGIATFCK